MREASKRLPASSDSRSVGFHEAVAKASARFSSTRTVPLGRRMTTPSSVTTVAASRKL